MLSALATSSSVAVDSTPLLDQGPLGAQLRSTAPQVTPRLEAAIGNILNRPKIGSIKGDDARPTARERAQLAANPAFGRAYEIRPAETLRLLRWADEMVSGTRP